MGDTSIQWTDKTWNPVRGCSRITPGCGGPNKQGGCYAEKIAARFSAPGEAFHGFAKRVNGEARWTGKMALIPDKLEEPLRWRKPCRVFVNSMSDLFHENLPDEAIDKVFAVMALCPQHTFQVLTKRAGRMRAYLTSRNGMGNASLCKAINDIPASLGDRHGALEMPLPNVWLGVSVEDQTRADERIHELLHTPAAKRFISAEPLLGPVDLTRLNNVNTVALDALRGIRVKPPLGEPIDTTAAARLDWVIVGGESGPNPRPFNVAWARAIVDQCRKAGVSVFVKQLGANVRDRNDAGFEGSSPTEWPDIDPARVEENVNGYREEHQGAEVRIRLADRKGGDMAEWPEDLRAREFPA